MSWDIVVRRDASFEQTFTSSDGAQNHVSRCNGTLAHAEVDMWFLRVAPTAARTSAPQQPRRKWDGTDPPYFFTLAYATNADTIRYAETDDWDADLAAWFDQMRSCKE